jgi:hypothetical protein
MRKTIVLLTLAVSCSPAAAMEMTIRGDTLVMSGAIKDGDDVTFKELAKTPAFANVRTIVLHNSPGGRVDPVIEMSREIRKRGLSTMVDASRSYCASACTGLFIAGVNRYYLNAGGLKDGVDGPLRGLGFHDGSTTFSGRREYYGPATAAMINIYYEMGASGAAKIVSNADIKGLYRVSGPTALSLGIATSLGR